MSRTIPLIKANLKGFMRNWKSILLLVILPLILILVIFASFNPSGLRKVHIGYTLADNQTLDRKQFEDAVDSFTALTEYDELDQCMRSLRTYREYVCVRISGTGPYVLDVHYDNTREPVIWEIIERLDQAIRAVQKSHSKTIATDFLTRFQRAMTRLDNYNQQLGGVYDELGTYIIEVDGSIYRLQNARNDLVTTLDSMDYDIASARATSAQMRNAKNTYASTIGTGLFVTEQNIIAIAATPENTMQRSAALNNIASAHNTFITYSNDADQQINMIDNRINSYEQASARGRNYVGSIDLARAELSDTRKDLQQYKQRVSGTRTEMTAIGEEFRSLRSLDAETLVNPVVIHNTPTYSPKVDPETIERVTAGMDEQEAAAKGASFISLQTIFPTVLILITLFLSLLIGSFVALGEINAPSHQRLRLVKGIFLPEFIANFVSAFIIVIVPVIVVLIIGDWTFALGVFEHFFTLVTILFMLVSFFILTGFLLAYIIRKESLTLMTSTFLLVLLIFFSGFLLPLERMTPLFGMIAGFSPGALALSMFKQSVFYNSGFIGIAAEFFALGTECFLLLILTIIVRYAKE
jgi:hypothetical protein